MPAAWTVSKLTVMRFPDIRMPKEHVYRDGPKYAYLPRWVLSLKRNAKGRLHGRSAEQAPSLHPDSTAAGRPR